VKRSQTQNNALCAGYSFRLAWAAIKEFTMLIKHTNHLVATIVFLLIVVIAAQSRAQEISLQLLQFDQLQLRPGKVNHFRAIQKEIFYL
jgi:hypothetical protein|tara:strand:+ start:875 stop:1141 length:267 start_codon:yes stop_codon:yes gene_type:complete